MSRYAIEGLIRGIWSREAVGSTDDSTLFATRGEAEDAIPDLAEALGCTQDELRVVRWPYPEPEAAGDRAYDEARDRELVP